MNKCFRVLSCGLVLRIEKSEIRTKAHLALTKQVATESLVLLENKNRTLPLKVKTAAAGAVAKLKIAVVGPFADCQSCYYGAEKKEGKTERNGPGLLFVSVSSCVSFVQSLSWRMIVL